MENEIIEMDSSLAYSERKRLQNLKKRQDELFGGEENELVNLVEIINEILGVENNEEVRVTVSRSRFEIRNNYLKIRLNGKKLERYLNSVPEESIDTSIVNMLRNTDCKIDIEIKIEYPVEYPFTPSKWSLERYHETNTQNNGFSVENYLDMHVESHNILNRREWSPVITPKLDVKCFLSKILEYLLGVLR